MTILCSILNAVPWLLANASDLTTALGKIASVIYAVSLVVFFGALVVAAVTFTLGRTEATLHALIGAGLGGLSFLIVKVLFSVASPIDPGVELQGF